MLKVKTIISVIINWKSKSFMTNYYLLLHTQMNEYLLKLLQLRNCNTSLKLEIQINIF